MRNTRRETSSSIVVRDANVVDATTTTADSTAVVHASSTMTKMTTTIVPSEMTTVNEEEVNEEEEGTSAASSSSSSSSNPIVQLATYVKDTAIGFKNGLVEMNTSHRRCNVIREKQRMYAKSVLGTNRPRGIGGMQVGGIKYEEYDALRKGLVDRNKLFAVIMVSLCLPNYFVYYL